MDFVNEVFAAQRRKSGGPGALRATPAPGWNLAGSVGCYFTAAALSLCFHHDLTSPSVGRIIPFREGSRYQPPGLQESPTGTLGYYPGACPVLQVISRISPDTRRQHGCSKR